MNSGEGPTLEDVREAYGLESANDGATLRRYLEQYPQYAEDIVEFSRELSRSVAEHDKPLAAADEAFINTAWATFAAARAVRPGDFLLALSAQGLRELAVKLGFPLQVVAAFRARRVLVATVPRRVLATMAAELTVATDLLADWLSGPVCFEPAQSYKADSKPLVGQPVPLRQLLAEAGVPEAKIEELLAEAD